MKYHIWIVCGLVLLGFPDARAELTEQEHAQIAEAFNPTNAPGQVDWHVYYVYTNIWQDLVRSNPVKARELQYNILTNFVHFRSHDLEYWGKWGMQSRALIFANVCSFHCTTNDLPFVSACADFLGTEMVPLAARGDLPYRVWMNHNTNVETYGYQMVSDYRRLVECYEKLLAPEQLPAFRTNIVERARLSAEHRELLWGPREEEE